jgi:hypothetical protein
LRPQAAVEGRVNSLARIEKSNDNHKLNPIAASTSLLRNPIFPFTTRELVRAIESYLADRNQDPKKYVWRASGLKILEKIRNAAEGLNTRNIPGSKLGPGVTQRLRGVPFGLEALKV